MENYDSFGEGGRSSVLLIDDDDFIHELVNEALADCCILHSVESGEDALMVTNEWRPDLILLDVELLGMDGYETCRKFKELEITSQVPVMFLSGHDRIEDRLRGYEAGGNDYLIKPFDLLELKAKVTHLLALESGKGELKSMADFASNAAMTAMTSMSEMGSLLESLKQFNICEDIQSLTQTVIDGVTAFDLHSVVRISTPTERLILTDHGAATPLESSVVEHMAEMDRIVHFKSRMSINYEYVSLLISNMPANDEERCGRLRDHLAMLVEAADVRVKGILSMQESRMRGVAIERTVERITAALRDIDADQRKSRMNTSLAVDEMIENVERALMSIALTEVQETYLSSIVRSGIDKIACINSDEIDLQNDLSEIINELKASLSRKK